MDRLFVDGKSAPKIPTATGSCWNKHTGFPSREYFGAVDPRLAEVVTEKLPGTLRSPGIHAGVLTEPCARLLGLRPHIPVSAAIIDALLASERDKYISVQMTDPSFMPGFKPSASTSHLFALGESMGAGIVLQSAAVDPRIEAVVAEAPFASVREATYDYAGLRKYPWLGKTLFAPGTWTLLYRDEKLAGFPVAEVSPVKAVASRAFPVLLCRGVWRRLDSDVSGTR